MAKALHIILISIALALLSPLNADAQSTLKKVVESLENSDKGISTIYREKRNPKTRAVVNSEMLFEFDDQKFAQRIIDAMKKERANSVNYTINTGGRGNLYRIEFDDGKGSTSSYMLYINRNNQWTLSVKTSHIPQKERYTIYPQNKKNSQ